MDFKQFFRSLRHLNSIAYKANLVDTLKAENKELRKMLDELSISCRRGEAVSKTIRAGVRRKKGLPIRVAFLCENPAMWKAMREVVHEMNHDSRFEVILVRLYCKGLRKGGMDEYGFPDYEPIDPVNAAQMIDSYDEKTDTWLDIEELHPEYVFYMRPYDSFRHELHRISRVSQFAKVCYMPYGILLFRGKVEKTVYPEEFCSKLDFFFLSDRFEEVSVQRALEKTPHLMLPRVEYLGYAGLDRFKRKLAKREHKQFTMCWLPRWNTYENNSHFFEYKDVLLNDAKLNENSYLIMRPHPGCFSFFVKNNLMTQEEIEQLRERYIHSGCAEIDESDSYERAFDISDVLIADETSLIAEYYPTGKPIVFCRKETHFSVLMEKLSEGLYMADNEKELLQLLAMLRNGSDPLKEKREELIQKYLLNYEETAAKNIVQMIYDDANSVDLCYL